MPMSVSLGTNAVLLGVTITELMELWHVTSQTMLQLGGNTPRTSQNQLSVALGVFFKGLKHVKHGSNGVLQELNSHMMQMMKIKLRRFADITFLQTDFTVLKLYVHLVGLCKHGLSLTVLNHPTTFSSGLGMCILKRIIGLHTFALTRLVKSCALWCPTGAGNHG